MSSPTTPDDVRVEIDTELSDNEIAEILGSVSRDVERVYDPATEFDSDAHRSDFEAALTALRIATGRDRSVASESSETFSVDYEASTVAALRGRVARRDPGDEFSPGTTVDHASSRFVDAVTPGDDEDA